MSDSADEGAARRAELQSIVTTMTGIDEAMIGRLVETFYARVRNDDLIGPVFAAKVHDWDEHLAKLKDFWSSVTLMTGRYRGRPMQVHFRLDIEAAHFDRWLDLFETAAAETCPPKAAAYFIERARRIADSFELSLASARDQIAAPRHVRRPVPI